MPSHPLWRACSIAAALGGACTSAEPSAPTTQQAAAADAFDAETAEPAVEPAPVEPPPAPAPAPSQREPAEPPELSEFRFQDDPAEVLAVRGGPRPGRGKGKLAGLELELIPLGNEAVLRIINRGKTRAWWCSPVALETGIAAYDEHGDHITGPSRCAWTPERDKGCTFGGPTQSWSLAPGESHVVMRARVRSTEDGLLVELADGGSEEHWNGVCLVIDRDRARLRARWTIGRLGYRDDWCYADVRRDWDRLAGLRSDRPWSTWSEPDAVFPPRREDIDDLPILGELLSNQVEIVARRELIELP